MKKRLLEEIRRLCQIAGILKEEAVKHLDFSSKDNYFLKVWDEKYRMLLVPEYLRIKKADPVEIEYYKNDDLDSYPDFNDFTALVTSLNDKAPTKIYEIATGTVATGPTGERRVEHKEEVYDLHDGYYALLEDFNDNYGIAKKSDYENFLMDLEKVKQARSISKTLPFSLNEKNSSK